MTLTRWASRLPYRAMRKARRVLGVAPSYQSLYDEQAQFSAEDEVVGDGPYEAIGRLELDLLRHEGLTAASVLVDLGCGNGRLALHAIPTLPRGRYVGIDICRRFLDRAAKRTAPVANSGCRIEWVHQTEPKFSLSANTVDMFCAFSVFTHMELEDAYRYLKAARPLAKPGGKFVFSCLPLTLATAKNIFLEEAGYEPRARWRHVRNVVTSRETMEQVSRLAGWTPSAWYDGETPNIPRAEGGLGAMGQSCCVLEAR